MHWKINAGVMAPTYKRDGLNNRNMYGFFFFKHYKIYKQITLNLELKTGFLIAS